MTQPHQSKTSSGPWPDRDLLRSVLGLAADASDADLLARADEDSPMLRQLVLSLLARREPAADREFEQYLARGRSSQRSAEIVRRHGCQVLKGVSTGQYYRAPAFRPVGDLDVFVPSVPVLWQVVDDLLGEYPIDGAYFTRVTVAGEPAHYLVGLTWPSELPTIAEECIELMTVAYTGNFSDVPVRVRPPSDTIEANLIAMAEERFQRDFYVKDVLDLIVLTGLDTFSAEAAAARLHEYRVAPQALELCERALRELATAPLQELQRALNAPRPALEPEPAGPPARLEFGLQLRRPDSRREPGLFRTIDSPAGTVLITPVGDFLLVDSAEVDAEAYPAAVAALERQSDISGEWISHTAVTR